MRSECHAPTWNNLIHGMSTQTPCILPTLKAYFWYQAFIDKIVSIIVENAQSQSWNSSITALVVFTLSITTIITWYQAQTEGTLHMPNISQGATGRKITPDKSELFFENNHFWCVTSLTLYDSFVIFLIVIFLFNFLFCIQVSFYSIAIFALKVINVKATNQTCWEEFKPILSCDRSMFLRFHSAQLCNSANS